MKDLRTNVEKDNPDAVRDGDLDDVMAASGGMIGQSARHTCNQLASQEAHNTRTLFIES